MKRRGFLGLLGGAAVAGPAAAKQAVTAASHSQSGGAAKIAGVGVPNFGAGPMIALQSKGDGRKSFFLQEIADIRRRLTGKLTDEEIEERRIQDGVRMILFEIETSSLHSMSEAGKYRRMARYRDAEMQQARRFYDQRNLKAYIKELAGLD